MVEKVNKLIKDLLKHKLDPSLGIAWWTPERRKHVRHLIEDLERVKGACSAKELKEIKINELEKYLTAIYKAYKGKPEFEAWLKKLPQLGVVKEIDARIDYIVKWLSEVHIITSKEVIHLDEILPTRWRGKTWWKLGSEEYAEYNKEVKKVLGINEKYLNKAKQEILSFQESLEQENPKYKDLDRIYKGLDRDWKEFIDEKYGKENWKTARKKANLEFIRVLEKQYEKEKTKYYKEWYGGKDGYVALHQNDWKISIDYIPVIATIQKMFKENLAGKTIIEVGPGTKGQTVLASWPFFYLKFPFHS